MIVEANYAPLTEHLTCGWFSQKCNVSLAVTRVTMLGVLMVIIIAVTTIASGEILPRDRSLRDAVALDVTSGNSGPSEREGKCKPVNFPSSSSTLRDRDSCIVNTFLTFNLLSQFFRCSVSCVSQTPNAPVATISTVLASPNENARNSVVPDMELVPISSVSAASVSTLMQYFG